MASYAYEYLPTPFQDILLMLVNYKFKFFPLNYNCIQFFENQEEFEKNNYSSREIDFWMNTQRLTPFKHTKEELINASLNTVIAHLYTTKPFQHGANKIYTKLWIKYAKMTNLFEEIKQKYPKAFEEKK